LRAFDLRGDFLIEEVDELRLLSTLTARLEAEEEECFFIFFPFEDLTLLLEALQQGQAKYMYPAIPKIKIPKTMRRLRLPIKLASSSFSKLKAKADEAHAAKIKKNALIETVIDSKLVMLIGDPGGE
jgi:hypothetical protein